METIAGGLSELAIHDGSRGSKKQNTDTEHAVVSSDDLLIKILLLSPTISVIRWKSVSKRWFSLITSPSFALFWNQIHSLDPPSGFFLRRDTESSSIEYDFVRLDIRYPASTSPPNINFTGGSAAGNVEIFHSCNGLLLCCIENTDDDDKMIYVCNPSLNLFRMLPKQNYRIRHIVRDRRSSYVIGGMKMAFDPTKSPHYKVIHAAPIGPIESEDSFIQLQIYFSETGNWSVINGVRFRPECFISFFDGVYWNDGIWWQSSLCVVEYLKLNVLHPVLTAIRTPKITRVCDIINLFESRGRLLLFCNNRI